MQNARIAIDQEQYQKELQIDYFISTLEELNASVTEFDEHLWITMVDHVVVHSKEDIRVFYRDGIEK